MKSNLINKEGNCYSINIYGLESGKRGIEELIAALKELKEEGYTDFMIMTAMGDYNDVESVTMDFWKSDKLIIGDGKGNTMTVDIPQI